MIGVTVFVLTFLYLCDICVAPVTTSPHPLPGAVTEAAPPSRGWTSKLGRVTLVLVLLLCCCCVVARVTDALLLCVVAAAATTGLYSAGDITLLLPRCPAAASQHQHRTGSCVCCELPGPHQHSQHQARQEADLTKHFTLCVAGRQHGWAQAAQLPHISW